MRIEVKVAIIGAAAAIIAALIPLVWSWVGSGPDNTPAKITLTVAQNASPYQAYAISETPPAFSQAKAKANEGYFLWPEADLSELLPILSLGAAEDSQVYPNFSDISDETDEERNRHLQGIWSVVEIVGKAAKKGIADIPSELVDPSGSPLIDSNSSDSEVGLQLLRAVYLGDQARVADANNAIVKAGLTFSSVLFPDESLPHDEDEQRAWYAARFLSQRRVYPVLDVVISNENDTPVVVTGLVVDVLATAPAMSGLETGALDVLDIIKVKLDPKGGPHPVALNAPLQIAAKDTARIRLEVSSDVLFGFLARIDVVRGAETVGTAGAVIVDIGFQPPNGSKPI